MQKDQKQRTPCMQFYFRQFSGDEQVMAMDLDVVGAHILLMCAAGASNHGWRLVNDDRFLRSQIKFPSDEDWARIKLQLLSGAWKISQDGKWWVQEGQKRSLLRYQEFIEKQRQKGQASAAKRRLEPKVNRGSKSVATGRSTESNLSFSSSTQLNTKTPSISPPSQESLVPQALSSHNHSKAGTEPQYEPGEPILQERNHGSRKRNRQASGAVHAEDPHKYDGVR